jgi:TolB-like protein/Flp pilus assembly protein TadD
MKRCPECGRDYNDDSMSFCLDDGSELLFGPASGSEPGAIATGFPLDEPQTAILHSTAAPGEAPTQAQIHTTEQTAVLPGGAEAERSGGFGGVDFRGATIKRRLAYNRVAQLLVPLVGAVVILVGGFVSYRYFSASGSGAINSIAVMPFENRNSDADTDYLSDGLAESVIYRLSQIPDLKVSPTSSVFRYKGKETDPQTVAKELGVDSVMTGRITQRGDNLTISVNLVDARTNKSLWGEQYERKLSELLTTQREIVAEIVSKLQLKLSGESEQKLAKKYTGNPEAYQAYLKGRYFWNRRTAENLQKAIEQFKEATDEDPSFALAYAGLADCYLLLPEYAGTPINEAMPQAKAYAERAIAIDENIAEGHTSLGGVSLKSWKWAEAEREFKRAIELNPNYATAYHWYCVLLRSLGRFEDAAQKIEKAHELDPLSSVIGNNVAQTYMIRKDFAKMNESALKLIELYPTYNFGYQLLGESYLKLGRETEALANLQKSVEMSNRATSNLSFLGHGYAVTGKQSEAKAIINELEERYAKKESSGRQIAAIYAGLGEKGKAFEWLEKDFQSLSGELAFIRWYMQFEPLRDDPRYKELIKRMGLPE